MNDKITLEKLEKYFKITKEAIDMINDKGFDEIREEEAKDVLSMAENYYSDAKHFFKKEDYVLAFAALNYAHGWLDAGARLALFKVSDSRLFTVDEDRFNEKNKINELDEETEDELENNEITSVEAAFEEGESDAELLEDEDL